MWSLSLLSTALLLTSPLTLAQQTFKIHHRFLPHPSPDSPPTFQQLGNLVIQDTLYSLEDHSNGSSGGGQVDDGNGWYQVGVQLGEHDVQEEWLIGSTRSCYLSSSPPKIQIHLTSTSTPSSISILPSSSSHTCSSNSTTSVKLPSRLSDLKVDFPQNTQKTFGPSLAPPPTVDPSTGAPAPPEVEKTFFQKYWMYIVGIALFFAVQMGPDEPKGAAGAK
ncbi:hypothetical protein I302_105625 [Kwoniella bestiolae CBS 10118]|uniref:Uncharacterized protein n=1 Tax=Kwoniella bestiolae CBS 10118 TaxID=1296100 RepID=A0A1B9G1N6_9TREE|nr:hypothetical protein I302_04743 [Kwoniella bestiolae CBS 10118]OCF24933.1 hypothetical protein I302_04743 [Kwoniella bestiolae CBS 10118]